HKALHAAGRAVWEFLQHHAFVLHGRKIVRGRPALGRILGAPIERIALEGLERDGGIAEIFEAHLVEVIASDIYVEILAPIVLHALECDDAASGEYLDSIGPIAERRF